MGLDLLVEGCARPGNELEWRQILTETFGDEIVTQEQIDRFETISIPAHEQVDAPRVGIDPEADAWMIQARRATTPDEIAAVLQEFHGYHVLALARSDGLPAYSHAGLYEGVDETSFRGKILEACSDVLPASLIEQAWANKFPEDAIAYGRALLAAADIAEAGSAIVEPEPAAPARQPIFSFLRRKPPPRETLPRAEQIEAVRAAGRWFLFWGERGHAIRAWF